MKNKISGLVLINKLFLVLLIFTSILSCGGSKSKPENADKPISMTNINNLNEVYALGQISPMDEIVSLSSEVPGVVTKIYKNAGDSAKKGDPIIELKHEVQSTLADETRIKIKAQESLIKIAEFQYEKQKITVENNKKLYDRVKSLFGTKAETGQKLDDTEADFNNSEIELKRLKEETENAKIILEQYDAELRNQLAVVDQYIIRAPNDGKLLKLDILEGGSVAPGISVGEFAPSGPTIAICEIDELFSDLVRVGENVVLRKMGSKDEFTSGTVYFTAPYLRTKSLFSNKPGEQEDRRIREVRIKLNDNTALYNLRVDCYIKVK